MTKKKRPEAAAVVLADGRRIEMSRPVVVGTLNVTPDSFSDGGRYTSRSYAVGHALEMEGEGADIIDIGGESTRPGAEPVDADREMRRVLPVIEGIRRASNIPISVDTYKGVVARAALNEGADIINDVSALRFDDEMADVVAENNVPVVLMHMKGMPRDMQDDPHYDDCLREIDQFFAERLAFCRMRGIEHSKVIIDPGIGFGKRLEDNLAILAGLGQYRHFGLPLMVGASRKRFIAYLHPSNNRPDQRLGGSVAAAVEAVVNGADIVRVHDVSETVEALKVVQAVRGASK